MNEYSITLFEACEILNRSKKTLSRYIRQGRLTPQKITSQQGTLEYRFSKADLEALRLALDQEAQEQTRQDTPDKTGQARQDTTPAFIPLKAELPTEAGTEQAKTDQTGQGRRDETGHDRADGTGQNGQYEGIITILKETTELLKDQLTIKDKQIGTLNEQVHKLIERDRETNILLKGLQDNLMLLDLPKQRAIDIDKTGRDIPRSRGERVKQVILSALLLITLGVFFYYNLLPAIRGLLNGK
jgi:hypothetical protein